MAQRAKEKPKKPSVLVVGDGVVPTGFARVVHSILHELHSAYEFHHLAVNYSNQPHDLPWDVRAANQDGDYLGTNRLDATIAEVRPELVFLINDVWVIANYADALRKHGSELKVIAYSPVDAGPLEPGMVEGLLDLDAVVLYTEFGHREVDRAFAGCNGHVDRLPQTVVIPHGVDTNVFYPYARDDDGRLSPNGRRIARRELFKHDEFANAFIVLNANRNQPRKRIDITIKGFALFARDKPANVKLYLHMGVEDLGWNVIALARRHGIEDRLILTADLPHLPAVPDDTLNRIYNCCDVGVNTSIGEGWGLVSFEHAAAGGAQVVPRHSACEELWSDAAVMLEPCMSLTIEKTLGESHFVSPEEVARGLDSLYESPDLLAVVSAKSYETATRPEYRWPTIAGRWGALFDKTISR